MLLTDYKHTDCVFMSHANIVGKKEQKSILYKLWMFMMDYNTYCKILLISVETEVMKYKK